MEGEMGQSGKCKMRASRRCCCVRTEERERCPGGGGNGMMSSSFVFWQGQVTRAGMVVKREEVAAQISTKDLLIGDASSS